MTIVGRLVYRMYTGMLFISAYMYVYEIIYVYNKSDLVHIFHYGCGMSAQIIDTKTVCAEHTKSVTIISYVSLYGNVMRY